MTSGSDIMVGAPPPLDKRVTLANFDKPPFNRWTYGHLRELVPTRAARASGRAAPLPERPVDLSAVPVAFPAVGAMPLSDWLDRRGTDAFLVLHRGDLVFERYFNGHTADRPHLMFSVTKSLTGTMALMLMDKGDLDEHALVGSILPELADTAFGDATARQVLDMTVSVAYDETYAEPDSDIGRFLTAMLPGGEGLHAHLAGLSAKDAGAAHGDGFMYATPITEVLAWIVRRVSGLTLAEALESMIWRPLGTETEAYYWLDFHGVEMGGGGLCATARDLARFGRTIANGGLSDGRRVLPEAVATRILSRRNSDLFATRQEEPWYGEVGAGYHDQWWSYAGGNAVTGIGIFGQFLFIDPDTDTVIVKQSSNPEPDDDRDLDAYYALTAVSRFLATRD
jgi:CubicO group peptidase (beta-lactamase class C family)